jgi:hypothetical protein
MSAHSHRLGQNRCYHALSRDSRASCFCLSSELRVSPMRQAVRQAEPADSTTMSWCHSRIVRCKQRSRDGFSACARASGLANDNVSASQIPAIGTTRPPRGCDREFVTDKWCEHAINCWISTRQIGRNSNRRLHEHEWSAYECH